MGTMLSVFAVVHMDSLELDVNRVLPVGITYI